LVSLFDTVWKKAVVNYVLHRSLAAAANPISIRANYFVWVFCAYGTVVAAQAIRAAVAFFSGFAFGAVIVFTLVASGDLGNDSVVGIALFYVVVCVAAAGFNDPLVVWTGIVSHASSHANGSLVVFTRIGTEAGRVSNGRIQILVVIVHAGILALAGTRLNDSGVPVTVLSVSRAGPFANRALIPHTDTVDSAFFVIPFALAGFVSNGALIAFALLIGTTAGIRTNHSQQQTAAPQVLGCVGMDERGCCQQCDNDNDFGNSEGAVDLHGCWIFVLMFSFFVDWNIMQ